MLPSRVPFTPTRLVKAPLAMLMDTSLVAMLIDKDLLALLMVKPLVAMLTDKDLLAMLLDTALVAMLTDKNLKAMLMESTQLHMQQHHLLLVSALLQFMLLTQIVMVVMLMTGEMMFGNCLVPLWLSILTMMPQRSSHLTMMRLRLLACLKSRELVSEASRFSL